MDQEGIESCRRSKADRKPLAFPRRQRADRKPLAFPRRQRIGPGQRRLGRRRWRVEEGPPHAAPAILPEPLHVGVEVWDGRGTVPREPGAEDGWAPTGFADGAVEGLSAPFTPVTEDSRSPSIFAAPLSELWPGGAAKGAGGDMSVINGIGQTCHDWVVRQMVPHIPRLLAAFQVTALLFMCPIPCVLLLLHGCYFAERCGPFWCRRVVGHCVTCGGPENKTISHIVVQPVSW